ncbi:MAG TPA: hypothetical protein VIF61_05615 [Methylocystis sp.]|jgi:hypothetical protein
MNNVVPFPGEQPPTGDGGGPEDPMLEQRVGKLEEKVPDRLDDARHRLHHLGARLGDFDLRHELFEKMK